MSIRKLNSARRSLKMAEEAFDDAHALMCRRYTDANIRRVKEAYKLIEAREQALNSLLAS